MGTRYDRIEPPLQKFIEAQHIFFTGTAGPDGRVNVSPKGMDSLRILGPNRIVWRNFTGSGNETAAHLDASPRMTLMWCAFAGPPMILRAYGTARAIHRLDPDWAELDAYFTPHFSARQVFDLKIDLVQKSCGYGVPELDYRRDRPTLSDWAERKGEDGIHACWEEENSTSLDGQPTGIARRNLGE